MYTTSASMALLALLLKRSRRVLVVDLPGFDYSFSTMHADAAADAAPSPRPVSLERCISAVEWLVRELAPDGSSVRVDLAGHSFGANVALAVARACGPQTIRHLHMITPGGASAAAFSSITNRRHDMDALTAKFGRLQPAVVRTLLGIFASPNTLNLVYEPSYINLVRRRHCAAPPTFTPPCLLLFGDRDDLVTARPAAGLAASFPNATAVCVAGGLHQMNCLNPALICQIIEAFAAKHRGHAAPAPSPRPLSSLSPLALSLELCVAAVQWASWSLDWLAGVRPVPLALADDRRRVQAMAQAQ